MANQITRFIQKSIEKDFHQHKVIIIYGPRQTGKTTLVKQILKKSSLKSVYFNCDEPDINQKLSNKTSSQLKLVVGDANLVILDEAQRIPNIGLSLKLLIDTFPHIQLIATGSSSFELANTIIEPLTGRNYTYTLYPLSEFELTMQISEIELQRTIENRLIYGMYPQILLSENSKQKQRNLLTLKNDYLLKDILIFEGIKFSTTVYKLLQALALQIGQEVSPNELSQLIGVNKQTIRRYIDILEKAFIIFRLSSFNRNLRKEIAKRDKFYFIDVGVRNAIINNFNPLSQRNDTGQLWENYCMMERIKYTDYTRKYVNRYFWRTYDQQEIDLIEESGGILTGYEIKWGNKPIRPPKIFIETYPKSSVSSVNPNNYLSFIS